VPVGYAHRGFSLDGAENSIAAFQAAVTLGYTHLETDARVSADGVAVAFHDQVLDRVTNSTGALARLPWSDISQARIMGREPIPRLDEVLDAFGDCRFNIDVKSDAAIGPTLDALRRTNAWSRVRLAAFSHRRLAAIRRAAGPGVATALSPPEVARVLFHRGRPPAGATAAQVPTGWSRFALVTPGFVERAHRLGLEVHVWTINERSEMERLFDLGVDAVMSDRADVLADVLAGRGAWPA
jgi:glycerophosphoryl diester phosphodiesterase